MSERKETIVTTEAPDAEVELTAEDLRELSEPGKQSEPECDPINTLTPARAKAKTTAAVPNARALQLDAGRAHRPVNISPLSLSLTLAVSAIGALCLLVAPIDEASQPVTQDIQGRAPQPERPESEPNVEGEPVRFANPFDAHEVFEFPAGTSEAEARDAVAEVLLSRAVERRQFDALVSKNH